MKVMFACLADHASADVIGKLSVNGIFDRISAANFSAAHPQMNLVIRLMFEYEDNGKKNKLNIELIDADGKQLLQADAEVDHAPIKPGAFTTMNQIITFSNIVMAKPGRFRFVLKADESHSDLACAPIRHRRVGTMRPSSQRRLSEPRRALFQ